MGSLARQGTLSKDAGSGLFSLTLDELQNEIVGSGKFLGSMNMVSTRLARSSGGYKGGECGASVLESCAAKLYFCWFALVGSLQWRPTCDRPPLLLSLRCIKDFSWKLVASNIEASLCGAAASRQASVFTVRSDTGPQPGSQHCL